MEQPKTGQKLQDDTFQKNLPAIMIMKEESREPQSSQQLLPPLGQDLQNSEEHNFKFYKAKLPIVHFGQAAQFSEGLF